MCSSFDYANSFHSVDLQVFDPHTESRLFCTLTLYNTVVVGCDYDYNTNKHNDDNVDIRHVYSYQ